MNHASVTESQGYTVISGMILLALAVSTAVVAPVYTIQGPNPIKALSTVIFGKCIF